MRVATGRRAGRGHRQRGVDCQDAFAVLEAAEAGRVAVAVADGLGSRSQSQIGSQAACDAAVAHLISESVWDEAAMRRTFEAAHAAVLAKAAELGVEASDLASTLHVAGVGTQRVVAASVGDGAIVSCQEAPQLLLAPEESEYANEVVPITEPRWAEHFRYVEGGPAAEVLVFTDGLTRLLLRREGRQWEPFLPFFDALLERLRSGAFDPDLVVRFLEGPQVDAAWDDDKCLVVVSCGPGPD